MRTIEKLEQVRTGKLNLKESGIHYTLYYAYEWTKDTLNKKINFNDVIWEKDVKEIVENCKELNIDSITISCSQTGMADVLAEFEKEGCKLVGLTKITTRSIDIFTNKPEEKNAFELVINK